MTRKRLVLGSIALSAALAIPLAAKSCETSRVSAEDATGQFHERLARGAYSEIVQSAAPEFQKVTTVQDFSTAMETVKQHLGLWQSSEPPTWRVLAGWSARTVTLVYSSRFERGTAVEEFVWRLTG